MYLFFDTETTGLPKDWRKPYTEVDNWPHLVQLAWLVMDKNANVISSHNFVVTPNEGVKIPAEASDVHGITNEHAEAWGVKLYPILRLFARDAGRCKYLVAHNIKFDANVVLAEYQRFRASLRDLKLEIEEMPRICTMEASTDFCQLPAKFGTGYKWPNLQELHKKLFNEGFEGAHDAMIDIQAAARCFFELKSKGIIDIV